MIEQNELKKIEPSNVRIKPAVPAKPQFIPPPNHHINLNAVQNHQIKIKPAKPVRRHHSFSKGSTSNSLVVQSIEITSTSCDHLEPLPTPKVTTHASPNLGCSNDCCGIMTNSHPPIKPLQQNNTNNNNISNPNKKSEENRTIKSSTDSVDSSLSSSSGGFRDPEFIARQTLAFELYQQRENVKKPPHPPPQKNIHNISQYQKSSKQLEQMLSQRIEKGQSTVVPLPPTHLRAKSIDSGAFGAGTDVNKINLGASTIPKKIQQKLQEEMKLQCKSIKDKFLIERRRPQEHYKAACSDNNVGVGKNFSLNDNYTK